MSSSTIRNAAHGEISVGTVLTWTKRYTDEEVRAFRALSGAAQDAPPPAHLPYLMAVAPLTKLGGDLDYLSRRMAWTSRRPIGRDETLTAELRVTRLEPAGAGAPLTRIAFDARVRCGDEDEPVISGGSTGLVVDRTALGGPSAGAPSVGALSVGRPAPVVPPSASAEEEGAAALLTRTATAVFTTEDIDTCARLTGDLGAHHMTGDRRMTQGVLTLTAVPLLADPGAHVRELALAFLAPVHAGDAVTATVRLAEAAGAGAGLPAGRSAFGCGISVAGAGGGPVLTGTGVVELPARDLP
ncbi:hypothetical protein [Streptomyces huiliensis]|uniref:hypothetical protein n=1 Tax=Streptomyces huiliensis TaxID=2876027 RepID=UPI001CBB993F|nr:hypothetical protein [Streptomyces huiliensis]MBZ4319837.1 hypothetical protein [Streptomyces huiliensis]